MLKPWKFQVGKDRKPWKHQLAAFERHKDAEAWPLFHDMGTGKTAVAVNIMERHLQQGDCQAWFIGSPLSVLDSWAEELERCFPASQVLDLTKFYSKSQRLKALATTTAQYILLNYESLDSLYFELLQALSYGPKGARRFGTCLDESTAIKNPRAQRSKAAVALGRKASYRGLMTGTPVPQGPEDIFGQYLYADPSVFGTSFVSFRNYWMVTGGFQGKQILGLRHGMEAEFNKRIYSMASRVTKAECLDMPPKVYEIVRYDLSPTEKQAYQDLAKDWVAEIKGGKVTASNGLTKSLRLAQICTGFVGSVDENVDKVEHELGDTKLKALEELVERLDGKFIVWCAWHHNVRQVMGLLKRMGVKAVDYYGLTADKRVNEMEFREGSARAFVGTGASGGAGLNLQGPDVKSVIYFSQDYSVFKRQQSEDRAYRGAITHQVTVFDLVARGTLEAQIVRGLRDGRDLQEYILQKPEAFVEGR